MLTTAFTFSPAQDESFFQQIPAAAAVFLLRGDGEPYVSKTANLRRRLTRLLGRPAENSKRLNLRERVREVEFSCTGSDFESNFLLYRLLRENFPDTYAKRLRLRPASLVKLHLENEYPRASVTTRMGRIVQPPRSAPAPQPCSTTMEKQVPVRLLRCAQSLRAGSRLCDTIRPANDFAPLGMTKIGGDIEAASKPPCNLYYGPFPSRATAEKFANDALDFFKMRRCVDDLHPDPAFPGCVYSEMKMCLAPCFKGCSDEEYHAEVARVQEFFDTSGESLTRELSAQRERASAELAFEGAAAIHAKIEKLKPVLAQLPEIVRRLDRLQIIIIQPSAEPGRVFLFYFGDMQITGPVMFQIEQRGDATPLPDSGSPGAGRPRAMESRVEEAIQSFPPPVSISAAEQTEHLAILKRWYYRSHRTGEIFFADVAGNWPLRRMVRGIGRVYRGERDEQPPSFSATEAASSPS